MLQRYSCIPPSPRSCQIRVRELNWQETCHDYAMRLVLSKVWSDPFPVFFPQGFLEKCHVGSWNLPLFLLIPSFTLPHAHTRTQLPSILFRFPAEPSQKWVSGLCGDFALQTCWTVGRGGEGRQKRKKKRPVLSSNCWEKKRERRFCGGKNVADSTAAASPPPTSTDTLVTSEWGGRD